MEGLQTPEITLILPHFQLMYKIIFICFLGSVFSLVGNSQPVMFHLSSKSTIDWSTSKDWYFAINQHAVNNIPLFKQQITPSFIAENRQSILLGIGGRQTGMIDSIIWSEGDFYLSVCKDSISHFNSLGCNNFRFRSAIDLSREHEEGSLDASSTKNGLLNIPNNKGRKPKKVVIDLSANYVNLDYPADTYPIYRHYEWIDEYGDGLGNSFMLTYSDNTNHEAWIRTNKIGDVKLYEKPFQEIYLHSLDSPIQIEMTTPQKVRQRNIDYALKGPCRIIYYLEW